MATKAKVHITSGEIKTPSGVAFKATLVDKNPKIIEGIGAMVGAYAQLKGALPGCIIMSIEKYEELLAALWASDPALCGKIVGAMNLNIGPNKPRYPVPIMTIPGGDIVGIGVNPSVTFPDYYRIKYMNAKSVAEQEKEEEKQKVDNQLD